MDYSFFSSKILDFLSCYYKIDNSVTSFEKIVDFKNYLKSNKLLLKNEVNINDVFCSFSCDFNQFEFNYMDKKNNIIFDYFLDGNYFSLACMPDKNSLSLSRFLKDNTYYKYNFLNLSTDIHEPFVVYHYCFFVNNNKVSIVVKLVNGIYYLNNNKDTSYKNKEELSDAINSLIIEPLELKVLV